MPPKITHAYIDASNLFYGGRKSLGWSIDYKKLIKYLRSHFGVSIVYYFGGVETHQFVYDNLINETINLIDLEKYFTNYIRKKESFLPIDEIQVLYKNVKQIHFYQKLEEFGYQLVLKPVKKFIDNEGQIKLKANCDSEMVFYLMRDKNLFDCAVVLSGDGDFLCVLKHLRDIEKKEVIVLAYGSRTSVDIKRFVNYKFVDFGNLRDCIELY